MAEGSWLQAQLGGIHDAGHEALRRAFEQPRVLPDLGEHDPHEAVSCDRPRQRSRQLDLDPAVLQQAQHR